VFVQAALLHQGIFLGALALQGTIHYQEQDPVGWGWESREALDYQPVKHLIPWPARAGYQPPQMPPSYVLRRIAAKGFTGGFLKTGQMCHHQPAKDQKVTVAKYRPQRLKNPLYFFGQSRYLDHGWPLGKRTKKVWLSSFYPRAGQPASLFGRSRGYAALKRQSKNCFLKVINL
jgi:hypothetical protein